MGQYLKQMYQEANRLKTVMLEDNNVGILLYLAKYNPRVSRKNIQEKFGKESIKGLDDLKRLDLVTESEHGLSLTSQGIFQVEGLITLAV